MIERPILFSGPLVRAILAGAKTVTRRPCKPAMTFAKQPEIAKSVHPDGAGVGWIAWFGLEAVGAEETRKLYPGPTGFRCPYGECGDGLWVRETWAPMDGRYSVIPVVYRADGEPQGDGFWGWKPSIHMPRAFSRIDLAVVSVRVERLHDITEADARAEGIEPTYFQEAWSCMRNDGSAFDMFVEPDEETRRDLVAVVHRPPSVLSTALDGFRMKWIDIYGLASWDSNPWVWRVEFKRVRP